MTDPVDLDALLARALQTDPLDEPWMSTRDALAQLRSRAAAIDGGRGGDVAAPDVSAPDVTAAAGTAGSTAAAAGDPDVPTEAAISRALAQGHPDDGWDPDTATALAQLQRRRAQTGTSSPPAPSPRPRRRRARSGLETRSTGPAETRPAGRRARRSGRLMPWLVVFVVLLLGVAAVLIPSLYRGSPDVSHSRAAPSPPPGRNAPSGFGPPGSRNDTVAVASTAGKAGYYLLKQSGAVQPQGGAKYFGAPKGEAYFGVQQAAGMAVTPSGAGYWVVSGQGGVYAFGDARNYGGFVSGEPQFAHETPAGLVPTPDGRGYWVYTTSAEVFPFGDARFYGAPPHHDPSRVNVTGMAATIDGRGYWIVDVSGAVFSFGDARHYGSAPTPNPAPVAAIMAAPDGGGYWVLDGAGGVHAFGSARTYRAAPGQAALAEQTVRGLVPTRNGRGYRVITDTGQAFRFGDA